MQPSPPDLVDSEQLSQWGESWGPSAQPFPNWGLYPPPYPSSCTFPASLGRVKYLYFILVIHNLTHTHTKGAPENQGRELVVLCLLVYTRTQRLGLPPSHDEGSIAPAHYQGTCTSGA